MSRGRICRLTVVFLWSTALACEGTSGTDTALDAAVPMVDAAAADPALAPGPQTPPMGQADIELWLAALHYKGWACETRIFPPRLNGAHGRHHDLARTSC